MSMLVEYKNGYYEYNDTDDFNDFMGTELFQVLIKDIRKTKNVCLKRNIEEYTVGGEPVLVQRGMDLQVDGIVMPLPVNVGEGIINYCEKYIFK